MTPWGTSEKAIPVAPGLVWHHTAGHGGLAVSRALADRHLSDYARSAPYVHCQGGFYWFEEDCAWGLPIVEVPEWADALATAPGLYGPTVTAQKIREAAAQAVAFSYPDHATETAR